MTNPERERMTDEQIAGVLASMTEGCECTGPMGHVAMVTCNTRRCMACEVKDIITQLRADLAVMKERAEKAEEAIHKAITGYESALRFERKKIATLREQLDAAREGLERIASGNSECVSRGDFEELARDTLARIRELGKMEGK